MKLSMWIIANLLESFEPEVHIQKESPRILRSARMAYATNCVYVQQDGKDCLYVWGDDYIRIPDLSAREGFELLQSMFDSMFDWHAQLTEAIERRDYQQVVNACYTVFKDPVMLLDGNNRCLATCEQYAADQVDDEWYHLKTYGYSSFESAKQMNEAQISYHMTDRLIRYRFREGSSLCNCLSAPVLHGGMPVGYVTVLEKDHPLNYGHMQMMSLVARLLAPTLSQEKEKEDESTPFLKRLLDGTPIPRKTAQRFYEQKRWSPEHTYRVIRFDFRQDEDDAWLRQNYFFLASLSAVFPEDLCGMYSGSFVILANDSLLPQEQRMIRLERQLSGSEVRVATSLPFPGFQAVPELYKQATFALDFGGKCQPERQFLDFYYHAVDYLIRSPYSPELCLAACHPDVYALYRFDEILYRTLWVYLVQDRSVTRTIHHLFVHKNTLLYRLRKIEEFITHSISDPYSREYMRLSFTLLERHAGLPNPPETPFPQEGPVETE